MARTPESTHLIGSVCLRRRNRIWHARYTTPKGRVERSLKVTNLRVAEKKVKAINDLLERGEYALLEERSRKKSATFAGFAEEFVTTYLGWTDSTKRSMGSIVRKLVEEFGPLPISSITAHQVDTYLARRREVDGLTVGSCNRYRSVLSTMFKTAVRWGYAWTNPVENIKTVREQLKKPNPYSEDEVAKLLDHLSQHTKRIALVAVDTGMRKGELQKLLWSDVDLVQRAITVRETKNKEDRVIPMTDRLARLFSEMNREWEEGSAQADKVGTSVFGPSADILKPLKAAAAEGGLDRVAVNQHRLRDTFGTRLLDAGVSLDRARKLMGHKSIVMTLRYAETRPQHLRDAIDLLNRQVGS